MDYCYLHPPKKARELFLPQPSIMKIVDGRPFRKIFHSVHFTPLQQQLITRLKSHLPSTQYDDATLLKFCVCGDFDLEATLQKIRLHEEWMGDSRIQTLSARALRILEEGVVYSYGRDYYYRPVVVVDMKLVNTSNNDVDEYYSAINALMKVVIQNMFLPGKIENIIVIVDASQLTLPISTVSSAIQKLTAAFPATLQHLFVINASEMTTKFFDLTKKSIPLITLRKIQILNSKQLDRLQRYISPDQLEKKHEGTLPNLTDFWPIKSTNKIISEIQSEREPSTDNRRKAMFDVEVQSVLNDSDFFREAQEEKKAVEASCCSGRSCRLF